MWQVLPRFFWKMGKGEFMPLSSPLPLPLWNHWCGTCIYLLTICWRFFLLSPLLSWLTVCFCLSAGGIGHSQWGQKSGEDARRFGKLRYKASPTLVHFELETYMYFLSVNAYVFVCVGSEGCMCTAKGYTYSLTNYLNSNFVNGVQQRHISL